MEILAAILYFSNFVLSLTVMVLAIMLFRHYRHCGWLLLAAAFLSPFWYFLLRLVHGRPLFSYISTGSDVNGLAHETIRYEIPGYYMIVVAGLLLLIRDARRAKQA
jgi:predicted membrane metal-binding protein